MKRDNVQRSKAVKWTLMWLLGIWGFLSFILIAGEEDPASPMPTGRFFIIKAVAAASLLLCCYVAKRLHAAGYLPDEIDKEDI